MKGGLVEVKVAHEVAEDAGILAYVQSRVRPSVRGRIEPLTIEKIILDELVVSVEGKDLVVDETTSRIWTDDDSGNAQAEPILVDSRWHDVIIKSAPIVPGEEDRGGGPVRTCHHGDDQARDVARAQAKWRWRAFAHTGRQRDTRDRREESR